MFPHGNYLQKLENRVLKIFLIDDGFSELYARSPSLIRRISSNT